VTASYYSQRNHGLFETFELGDFDCFLAAAATAAAQAAIASPFYR
jgi:hypothetical protein